MSDLTYEIKKSIGVLSESTKGWTKELNVISWNDKEPKFDVREWNPEHNRMSKGVTFSLDEMKKMKEFLINLEL